MGTHLRIEVERSGVWRAAPLPQRHRHRRKGEPVEFERPMRLTSDRGRALARTTALPLPDASVDAIECLDVLEFVRNDAGLVCEIARVLAPGGRLRLRVPAAGPLAGIDAYNLMRYVVDITHRGARPYEISEIGWRRHYRQDDIRDILDPRRFELVAIRRRKLALSEAMLFAAMLLFRRCYPSRDRYRAAQRLIRVVDRLESHLCTPIGSVLELEARRLP